MLVIALAIRLDSPGPAFFRQQRMGYRGDPFRMIKFRTMRVDAPADEDPRLAAITDAEDLRVTRVGRLLRRYRLDELPQVINVLKGEMSWIGPRPEAIPLSRWYEAELPFYRYRHIVRPGISGWAQVNQGHVADVDDVLEKLHYDFYYMNYQYYTYGSDAPQLESRIDEPGQPAVRKSFTFSRLVRRVRNYLDGFIDRAKSTS